MIKHQAEAALKVTCLSLLLMARAAPAQTSKDLEVISLIRDAMEAYSNLDLNGAKERLETILTFSNQISDATLARVYISLGIIWIGGFSDNAKGQEYFLTALCLDAGANVDPLYSAPEIDMMYNLAKTQVNPTTCSGVLANVTRAGSQPQEPVPPVVGPPVNPPLQTQGIPLCGLHDPISQQKQKYELPFYVEVAPDMASRISTMVVYYAFDSAATYNQLNLPPRGSGYGAMLDCDSGQIRIFDPATVTYYIEGLDSSGRVVCGEGSKNNPFNVMMMPDVPPVVSIAGMMPKECAPCPPWDNTCGRTTTKPGLGDTCQPNVGCAEGLVCSGFGICEEGEGGTGKGGPGPEKFYVDLTFGAGVGYFSKEMLLRNYVTECNDTDSDGSCMYELDDPTYELESQSEGFVSNYTGDPRGAINENKETIKGTQWSGLPLRLALGVHINPKISIEVSGRFDVYVATLKEPRSCWDYDPEWYSHLVACEPEPDAEDRKNFDATRAEGEPLYDQVFGERAVTVDDDDPPNPITTEEIQVAWLINARVRYKFFTSGNLALSFFGGLGYGHVQYRTPSTDADSVYFPMPGMVDIEVGLGLAYYFNKNFGFILDIPIDAIVGDGFAINGDLTLGLGVGF